MLLALWVVAGVICVVAVAAVADRLKVSAPLLLIGVGLAASFVPFVPLHQLQPEIILVGILPPLLFSAAYNTSFVDFRAKKGTIASLSVGLVIFTTLVVGFVAYLLVPGIGLAAGFALGAVVAPPDAVAATSIARRVGMPQAIVRVLEGESLVNDATALTALRAAAAAIGGTVTVIEVGVDFVIAAGGGIVIGILFAVMYIPIRRRITDPMFDTALSLATPYLADVLAESIHASGVIAVVVGGLLIGHKAPLITSGTVRLTTEANWRTIGFLLENGVFLMIGLQLPIIIAVLDQDDVPVGVVALACLGVFLTAVAVRFVWVFATGALARRSWFGRPGTPTTVAELTVISWAGMRGVVTLAAALTLPVDVVNRNILVLVAFFVVVASLLLQGTTLPTLVRRLGLPPPDRGESALEEAALLDQVAGAGFARLAEVATPSDPPQVLHRLRLRADDRRNAAWERIAEPGVVETPVQTYARLRLAMLQAERAAVIEARDSGGYDDDVIRRVIRLMDVEEGMLDEPRAGAQQLDRELTAPSSIAGQCSHLLAARDRPVPDERYCEGCVAEGARWVHLRMCLACGYLGCCDSSERRHATAHFHATEHPVMRSIEPGEAWRWCFVDGLIGSA